MVMEESQTIFIVMILVIMFMGLLSVRGKTFAGITSCDKKNTTFLISTFANGKINPFCLK